MRGLYRAVLSGNFEWVKRIVEKNKDEDINERDGSGKSALHYAAEKGYFEKDCFGKTPLHYADRNGHSQVVNFLKGIENLFLAVKGRNPGGIKGVINAHDEYGKTPLHYTVEKGYLDMVKILLEKGADINAKDNNGKTPLHYATEKGYIEAVNYFIEKGANTD